MKLTLENRQQNQLKEKLFYVGILTIITIVLWIGLSIYVSFSKTSIDPQMKELTKSLNPMLDHQALIKYTSSRVPAPEQFRITTVVKSDNEVTATTKIIDPFNPQQTIIQNPTVSSRSATVSQQ